MTEYKFCTSQNSLAFTKRGDRCSESSKRSRIYRIKMSRLLLVTDSNFVNNVGVYRGRKIQDVEVKLCQSRVAAMAEISSMEEGILIVARLDMIAADIASQAGSPTEAENSIELYYNQLFYKLINKVDEGNGKLAVGVVAPLFWTSHSKEAQRAMNHVYKSRKNTNMTNIWCSDYLKEVRAGVDGTHLTSSSANKYITIIYEFFAQISEASGIGPLIYQVPEVPTDDAAANRWADESAPDNEAVTTLQPPDDQVVSPARTTSMLSTSILEMSNREFVSGALRPQLEPAQSRLLQLAGAMPDFRIPPPSAPGQHQYNLAGMDRRIGSLESKAFYDNLTMAALQEELNTEANKAMLNRVSMSGVELPGLWSMDEPNRITAMKSKVVEIIDLIKAEGQVYEVQFVRHLNRQIRGTKFAVIEVKFPDPKQAKDLRAEFVKKRKTLPDKLNITPVVRKATRVRVEMLHSIAALLKRTDSTVIRAMCLQYAPKPVIKVVRQGSGGHEATTTLTFTDSIRWVRQNGMLDRLDLFKARERAGATYRGTLAQNFVLMD